MALYALLPCAATAWLGLAALVDEPWAQQRDAVVQQLLAMFRWGWAALGSAWPRPLQPMT